MRYYSKRGYFVQLGLTLSAASLLFSLAFANFVSATASIGQPLQNLPEVSAQLNILSDFIHSQAEHDDDHADSGHNHQDQPQVAAAQTQAQVPAAPTPAPTPAPAAVQTPYSLTNSGVSADLSALGLSQSWIDAHNIAVKAHNGAIPKRCTSDGRTGNAYAQGLAVRDVVYKACNNGQQPLYEAYNDSSKACTVVYNKNSSKRLAILAHELGHCVYHQYGDYGDFDVEYKQLRGAYGLSQTGIREVVADDYMICMHGVDTNWSGSANYYTRFNLSRPTPAQCTEFNQLVNTYLL